jgi:hypothetical protein
VATAILDLLAAAAEHVIPTQSVRKPNSYATWRATRHDDEFDAESSIRYLRSEGIDVDDRLLRRYAQVHADHNGITLQELPKIAPWIDRLDEPFIEYASFRKLRETPRYIEIITFTTPAISEDGESGFLELWTEDGRYAQMGSWWWVQMRLKDDNWTVDWMNLHAIS